MALDGYNEQEIIEARREKDEAFRGDGSPLPAHARESFKGLSYYEPDPDFAVEAVFTRAAAPDSMLMQTSSNELRTAYRVGTFSFSLNKTKLTLRAYQFNRTDNESYFVPFTDNTNGSSTYLAGRYLDVHILESDSAYVLDFNTAYSPYCAYNNNFSCPIVPTENNLNVAITAGEKK